MSSARPLMKPVDSVLDLIGNTPMVRLNRVAEGIRTTVMAKCEMFNPGASVKDRIGVSMIEAAERDGRLRPGGLVVEATSGNTGVGLALAAATKGYRCLFTIPDKMSMEKIKLLKALGAEVVVTPTVAATHPDYYVAVGRRIAAEHPNAIFVDQFYNPVNPETHERTTGPEIWEQTEGRITALVGGMGTGGTMTGCARYLKSKNPAIRAIGADPDGSTFKYVKDTGHCGTGQPYKVEGIGGDKVPGTLDLGVLDEIRRVSDRDAFLTARRFAREEGLFIGGSSGMAAFTALELAREIDDPNALVVVLLTDTGERYLSKLHSDEWMTENRFLDPSDVRVRDLLAKKRSGGTLVSVGPDKTAKQVLSVLSQYNISQVPVIDGDRCVGSVKEGDLMARIIEVPATMDVSIGRLMGAPYPVVTESDPLDHVARLFTRENDAVVVMGGGAITGILTRYDLIQHLTGR